MKQVEAKFVPPIGLVAMILNVSLVWTMYSMFVVTLALVFGRWCYPGGHGFSIVVLY
jgi:hypothetical protein